MRPVEDSVSLPLCSQWSLEIGDQPLITNWLFKWNTMYFKPFTANFCRNFKQNLVLRNGDSITFTFKNVYFMQFNTCYKLRNKYASP